MSAIYYDLALYGGLLSGKPTTVQDLHSDEDYDIPLYRWEAKVDDNGQVVSTIKIIYYPDDEQETDTKQIMEAITCLHGQQCCGVYAKYKDGKIHKFWTVQAGGEVHHVGAVCANYTECEYCSTLVKFIKGNQQQFHKDATSLASIYLGAAQTADEGRYDSTKMKQIEDECKSVLNERTYDCTPEIKPYLYYPQWFTWPQQLDKTSHKKTSRHT